MAPLGRFRVIELPCPDVCLSICHKKKLPHYQKFLLTSSQKNDFLTKKKCWHSTKKIFWTPSKKKIFNCQKKKEKTFDPPSKKNCLDSVSLVCGIFFCSFRLHHFSWGHHFSSDSPLLGVNWTVIRGAAPANWAIPVTPLHGHFSWGHPFNWHHSCIGSQLNCHKGSGIGKLIYLFQCLSYSDNSCRCHPNFPVFQLIGL